MPNFGFTYIFTADIPLMRHFYKDLLGLDLIWDEENDIAFKIKDHQLSIQFHPDFVPPSADFAIQPGWQGGTAARTSWSIEYDKVGFLKTVAALQAHGVRSSSPKPQWQGYWSFPVLDPMNNTIEVTCTEAELHNE